MVPTAEQPVFDCRIATRPILRRIEACTFMMGSHDPLAHPLDGEGPVRAIELDAFEISATAVTFGEFARFASETAYVTEAERIGWSAVFDGFVDANEDDAPRLVSAPWWRRVEGACWRAPEGPRSGIADRIDHPAVHVSHNDALAYCSWAGVRLPSEAEWECAARGGLTQQRYPWGDDLEPDGVHRCNVWQGECPSTNTAEDGYVGTAPVDAYEPNAFGLFNMVGNTWEWCADRFDTSYHARATFQNPRGPPNGNARAIRGGSYLCHVSYCARYRVSARSSATPDTATGHLGFRVARSV
jgi:formylglycine-generating enzyme